MKKLGFNGVAEVALGADMVADRESEELVEKGMLCSSCCPGFVGYIKKKHPEMENLISRTPSPMVMIGLHIKEKDPDAKVIFIGPCVAKKKEFQLGRTMNAIDCALTYEELFAMFESRGIDLESLEEAPLDEASPFGRNFARSGGVAQAVAEALKEKGLDKEFQLKAVPCSGIEACEVALLKAKRGVLDGNFIEGMACDGGCVQGAGCLVRSPRNRMDVEGHAKQASGRSITDAVAGRELVPRTAWGEGRPCAQASAKGGGGGQNRGHGPEGLSLRQKAGRRTWIQVRRPALVSGRREGRSRHRNAARPFGRAAFWLRPGSQPLGIHQDVVSAMLLELGDVGVDPAGELGKVALVDGDIIHVPTGQILGQNIEEYVVLILHDGLVDAALCKGAGGDDLPLIHLGQGGHTADQGLAEDKAFYLVVIREALVSPCGVEDPVADIDQVQQAPKLLVGKFQSHPQDLLLLEARAGRSPSLYYSICAIFVNRRGSFPTVRREGELWKDTTHRPDWERKLLRRQARIGRAAA